MMPTVTISDGRPPQPSLRPFRIVVHDYSGHPFQMQLARVLASRGHTVLHLHSAAFQTPKGAVAMAGSDAPSLTIEGIDLGELFHKYSFVRRLRQERTYGRKLAARLAEFQPDVVISSNTPLDAQAAAQRWARDAGAAFVFWLQDVYSVAIQRVLRRRLGLIGQLLAARFVRLESSLLRRSDAVVAITSDFVPLLTSWGVNPERVSVIENWAPLDEIVPMPRDNAWSRAHDLADVPVFLYAGTIGLKHDPSLLLDLAHRVPDARVVVVSEGLGADWLLDHGRDVKSLLVLPFQPFDRLSEVLATADVLVVILEPDAGIYSVPSKVLSSLAAGRAILAAIPHSNLAARTIDGAGAGVVVDPRDRAGFFDGGRALLRDSSARRSAADSARRYAEAAFDVQPIADRFEAIVREALAHRAPPSAGATVSTCRPPQATRKEDR